MNNTQCRKAYVSVNVDVDEEGTIRPCFIRWKDGLIFQIDKSCISVAQPQKSWRRRYSLHRIDQRKGVVSVS